MKKMIIKTLLCGTLLISLTGCGIQNTVEGSRAKEQPKSETEIKEISIAETKPAKVLPSVYPHKCTEDCFYVADGMEIVQCDLDGKELQRFEMPAVIGEDKGEEIEDIYVTGEEILYTVYCKDKKSGEYGFYEQLCSVPIQWDENGEQLLVEQTEKLFQVEDGMGVMYADQEVIAYAPHYVIGVGSPDIPYCEYDRVQNKQIPICKGDKQTDEYFLPALNDHFWGTDFGGLVLLEKNDFVEDTEDSSVYAHKMGSQEVTKVATHYIDYKNYGHGMEVIAAEGKVYYTSILDSETDKYSYDIWCYDSATGENSVLVREEELRELCPKLRRIDRLFVDGGALYVVTVNHSEDKKYNYVLSVPIEGKADVKPENELNQELRSLEGDSKKDDVYVTVEKIAGDKCYIWADDFNDDGDKCYVYDFSSREFKKVKESDEEYYFWKLGD